MSSDDIGEIVLWKEEYGLEKHSALHFLVLFLLLSKLREHHQHNNDKYEWDNSIEYEWQQIWIVLEHYYLW